MNEKTISSNWTKPMLILMTVFWIILPVILLYSSGGKIQIEGTQFVAVLIYVIFVGVTIYLAFSLAKVTANDNVIVFKKIFGKEKKYTFDKIGYPKSFRYGRLKFTSIDMKEGARNSSKYLILNNNAMLSGERNDAEEILNELRKSSSNK